MEPALDLHAAHNPAPTIFKSASGPCLVAETLIDAKITLTCEIEPQSGQRVAFAAVLHPIAADPIPKEGRYPLEPGTFGRIKVRFTIGPAGSDSRPVIK